MHFVGLESKPLWIKACLPLARCDLLGAPDLYASVYVKCLEWCVVQSRCRVWNGDCVSSLSEQWFSVRAV